MGRGVRRRVGGRIICRKENKTLGEQGKAGEEKLIVWRILNLRRKFFSRITSMLMCIFT